MEKSELLHDLLLLARPLQQESDAAIATMLSGTPVTVRMRAVMETLAEHGPLTVPDVGRHLGIQRQYVQIMMNEVEDAKLVTKKPNPAHKRSALFSLTKGGRDIIGGIGKAEAQVVKALATELTRDDVERAHKTIGHLLEGFRKLNSDLKQ